ncbi:hypothetical protein [Williamsia sp.]|uniref:hypothetical protein n=1 Tax=Williamsia sp. TaxID=1872085 RepID=UPI001A313D12|nr:hypothetical protein [Williamsia sp.]MBJ7287558.1 hypothetical protein [Williamsia sp.]
MAYPSRNSDYDHTTGDDRDCHSGVDDGGSPSSRAVPGARMPPPNRCAQVWEGPVGRGEFSAEQPLLWLLGAHGGAGVSVLTASIAPAGDCDRTWPDAAPETGDSPLVVIVARTHLSGLRRAYDLISQYHAGGTGAYGQLLGVITVADSDRPLRPEVRTELAVLEAAAPAHWHVGWIEPWRSMTPDQLPSLAPGQPLPEDKRDRRDFSITPPEPIRDLQANLLAAARTAITTR